MKFVNDYDKNCEYLIGKKILSYELIHTEREENQGIKFFLEDEIFGFMVYADCCSDGWIEHIENGNYLINSTVLSCGDDSYGKDVPEDDPTYSKKQEQDTKYFLKIKTDKGYVDIDYRNSSNGYYGTSLIWGIFEK